MKPKTTILFEDYAVPKAGEAQRQAALQRALGVAGKTALRKGLPTQIKTQLEYMGLWFWLGQALALGIFWLVLWQAPGSALPGLELQRTLALFGAVGPALAALAAPVMARSYTYDMWELEEAAYHNLPRITMLRFFICTLAAIPVLAGVAFAGVGATGGLTAFTALTGPFLLASGLNYFILGKVRGLMGSLCCVGSNLVLVAFLLVIFQWGDLLETQRQLHRLWPIGLLGLLLCLALFCFGARNYIKKSPFGAREGE